MKLKASSRAMAFLMCMVVLLSLAGTAFASVSVTPASGYAIATAAVNVRSGPDSSYSVLGWLQQGSLANVSGVLNTGWIQISYGSGYGYVNSSYMNISQVVTGTSPISPVVPVVTAAPVSPVVPVVQQPIQVPQAVVGGAGQYYVNASRLNVRSGPGTKYGVIGVLNRGQVVTRLSKSGNWTQIQLTNGVGYVYTKYISAYGAYSPTTPVAPVGPTYTTSNYVYATTALNIRSGPGEQYSVIGTVYASSVLRRLANSGAYTRIQVSNGSVAYVLSSYLMDYTAADATSRVVYPYTNNTFSTYPYYGGYYGGCYNNCNRNCSNRYYCPVCKKYVTSSTCPFRCPTTSCGNIVYCSDRTGSSSCNSCSSYYSGYSYGGGYCSSCSN